MKQMPQSWKISHQGSLNLAWFAFNDAMFAVCMQGFDANAKKMFTNIKVGFFTKFSS